MAVAIALVAWTTYRSWRAGPWDIPSPMAQRPAVIATGTTVSLAPRPPIGTDAIISRNLFDPERGAGASRDAEENSRSVQRVRSIVLVGTVIIGNNRVAILQDGTNPAAGQPVPGQRPPGQPSSMMRLKVGDSLEGFRLTEIADQRVVFARDATRVEVMLDFFRKVENVAPRPVAASGPVAGPGQVQPPPVGAPVPVPRVLPNLPRRGRIPVPGSGSPES
ncbi:MAG TPA: hypothetical protein VF208_06800 [Candidatus Binatia bacterium]